MLRVIVLLNNQIHLLDSNCIMVGRSGTGKNTLLKVVASLDKITICSDRYDISETIVKCLKG
jgi:ABC-type nitrate/sulfonate/bicarbonate transport system ATPase subunit